jgi:hypothetical protein
LLQASGGYLIGPGPGGANNVGAIYRMTPAGNAHGVVDRLESILIPV